MRIHVPLIILEPQGPNRLPILSGVQTLNFTATALNTAQSAHSDITDEPPVQFVAWMHTVKKRHLSPTHPNGRFAGGCYSKSWHLFRNRLAFSLCQLCWRLHICFSTCDKDEKIKKSNANTTMCVKMGCVYARLTRQLHPRSIRMVHLFTQFCQLSIKQDDSPLLYRWGVALRLLKSFNERDEEEKRRRQLRRVSETHRSGINMLVLTVNLQPNHMFIFE